jgi:hypothetical protein
MALDDLLSDGWNALKGSFTIETGKDTAGKPIYGTDWGQIASIGGLIGSATGLIGGSTTPPTGYQGSIPNYDAVRQAVPNTYDPNRRPGSGGQRYFTDTQYQPKSETPATPMSAEGLASLNASNPAQEMRRPGGPMMPAPVQQPVPNTSDYRPVYSILPSDYNSDYGKTAAETQSLLTRLPISAQSVQYQEPVILDQGLSGLRMASGGIARLAKGQYLNGSSDGMADKVPARIDGQQEARLSDGEFVIPADVVSHLGNGNSDAGAKLLKEMMSRVRNARTGNDKQGKEIDPKKFLPV